MAAYADEVLADAPLAYWRLDEASGAVLVDSSGNGRDGTWTGTPTFGATGVVPSEGKSVQFNGDDYATVPTAAWMLPATWTYEAVVNIDNLSDGLGYILTHRSDLEFYINAFDGSVEVYVTLGGTVRQLYADAAPVAVGTTRHLATSYDGATLSLFVDGTSVASKAATGTRTTPASPFAIGGVPGDLFGAFRGRMGHVAMYGTALSPARIAAHAAAVAAAPPVIEPTVPVDTFNRANGRTRTGIAEAWVEYELDDLAEREPLRIMAQQMPTPNLVDGRPA